MKILRDALRNEKVESKWGYSFTEFNPIQSTILKHRNVDANFDVSAKTSAGKTIVAEILMETALEKNKKAVFLSPLKAVAKQNYDEWTSKKHRWNNKKISMVTGDYTLTQSRIKELNNSDILLLTTDMLLSRCRNINSEKSDWIKEVHTLVVDEAHLTAVDGRGDNLEMGLVSFTNINKSARIVKLSATMDNLHSIAKWTSNLNNKELYMLESNYRPIDLDIHFIPYRQISYKKRNGGLFNKIVSLLSKYENDKFLIFFHSKKQIQDFYDVYKEDYIGMKIYTADVNKKNRDYILENFKAKEGSTKIILATSALAWGVNLPSRRVIIADVRFGLNFVKPYDIKQMAGRAGRKGYDVKGDCYVIVPKDIRNRTFESIKEMYSGTIDIKSTLSEINFTFHLIPEISLGNILEYKEAQEYFNKTLYKFQGNDLDIHSVIETLINCNALKQKGKYLKATNIGKISSWLFFYPQDINALKNNLNKLTNFTLDNDHIISTIVGDLYSHNNIMNNNQKDEVAKCNKFNANKFPGIVYCYYMLLNNKSSKNFNSLMFGVKKDVDRLEVASLLLDKMYYLNKKELITKMFLRFRYGISAKMTEIASIKGIGKSTINKLLKNNVTTIEHLKMLDNSSIKKIFRGKKTYDNILENIS